MGGTLIKNLQKKNLTSLLIFALRLHLNIASSSCTTPLKISTCKIMQSQSPTKLSFNTQQHTADILFPVWHMQSLVLTCHWLLSHCFPTCSHFSTTDVCYLFSISRPWQSYPLPCHQFLHKHPRLQPALQTLFSSLGAQQGQEVNTLLTLAKAGIIPQPQHRWYQLLVMPQKVIGWLLDPRNLEFFSFLCFQAQSPWNALLWTWGLGDSFWIWIMS